MKKFALILLSSLMLISLISCGKESSKEETSNTNAEVTDTVVKEDIEKDTKTPTDNSDLSKFSIPISVEENTEVAYSAGTYAEVDRAIDLYNKYLTDGLDSVSSELIYSDLDEDYNAVLVAPTDTYLKDLQLMRESIQNNITGKIVKATPANIEYSKGLKATEDEPDAIDLQIKLIIKVDSGNEYSHSAFVTVFNDKGVLKYQIRP